jgi:endogenous inhibitor of DNA gyrase (YacG/DUF329 family)
MSPDSITFIMRLLVPFTALLIPLALSETASGEALIDRVRDELAERRRRRNTVPCAVCGEPVDRHEAHTPHNPGCDGGGSDCDNRTHDGCCWADECAEVGS